MQFVCTMLLPEIVSASSRERIRVSFAALGWERGGADDVLSFSVPADPFAVDAPSIRLGGMLRDLCAKKDGFVESAKLTLCCRLNAYEIFTDVVTLGIFADGGVGLAPNPDVPPVFGDPIRLRDKMLAVVQRAAGKK